jgi:site-specific recombinase XerD
MSAVPAASLRPPGSPAAADWAGIEAAAPAVAAIAHRYLRQLGTFLAPASVDAAENALRYLARWMTEEAGLRAVGDVRRDHIEDFKVWLAARPRGGGRVITKETHRQRMRTVRQFFERIIEWDWPDAPPRNPVIAWDIPKKPEPLPKFLDDRDAATLMAAARAAADPRDRLVMELLARTGMRAGELAGLEADAVVLIGAAHWLRIPLGKLRNDRYVPLHPELVKLLTAWTAANLDHTRRHQRLVADHRGTLDRHGIARIVARVARAAGVPGVHPHRLRHTLATQFQMGRIASDATFPGKRDHAPAEDAGRGHCWDVEAYYREPAGHDGCVNISCIRSIDDASNFDAPGDDMLRLLQRQKRSDEGRCPLQPVVTLTHSACEQQCSLPVSSTACRPTSPSSSSDTLI